MGADAEPEDAVEVWPMNWPAVQLFLSAETLWKPLVLSSLAGCRLTWSGLDYVGLDVLMRRLRVDDPDGKIFGDLLHMEAAALPILNRPRES